MSTGILVFAARRVGLELLTYLLDIDAPVERVIAGSAEAGPILDLAENRGVPAQVYTPEVQSQLLLAGKRYGWLLNLWSPYILTPPVLELANRRLNTHPSLVPHSRGNDTAAWTIRNGLPAGVSLIEMHQGVDTGEVYAQQEVLYTFPIRGSELHAILQDELVALFKRLWPAIYSNEVPPEPQKGPVTYRTRRETERDRTLDASTTLTLEEFMCWALAHDFSPRTTAEVQYLDRRYKLTLAVEQK